MIPIQSLINGAVIFILLCIVVNFILNTFDIKKSIKTAVRINLEFLAIVGAFILIELPLLRLGFYNLIPIYKSLLALYGLGVVVYYGKSVFKKEMKV